MKATIMSPSSTRFYVGQRFKTYDATGQLIGKIGVLKITFSSVFYVTKDNVDNPIRVSINTANRNIFNGTWKQYFGEDN